MFHVVNEGVDEGGRAEVLSIQGIIVLLNPPPHLWRLMEDAVEALEELVLVDVLVGDG